MHDWGEQERLNAEAMQAELDKQKSKQGRRR
jgi:hypothetical protein